jgi:alpha-glucosidase
MRKAPNNNWWRGGVIYQIYPRSFADSNSDGVGDLPGITAKLDYVAQLGADAIWLSPIFKSPMKDFGYDVSDYCDIDPLFGTLDDFRNLVQTAHAKGLKVVIDQVLSHTSDQHPWFAESRASRDNAKADWYVWADALPDGNPPNNWLSVFGGSSWQWDTRRKQYYLHNFLASQPDLNFHNPQVVEAILGTVKFWLELGVDGYRLDTTPFYFHDQQLRSNPPRDSSVAGDPALSDANPYGWQRHIYDKERPENLGFLQQLRALVDQYPNTTMVGEIGTDDSIATMAEYTSGGDKLHMAYSFDLLGKDSSAPYLHGLMQKFADKSKGGWPSWALANHDVERVGSRWGGSQRNLAMLRLAAVFQMCLRGSPCLYQGDELGLPEADVAFEDMQDPYGITMWPEFKGRDGCRTPMPWNSQAADIGFGDGQTQAWLPFTEAYRTLAVDVQDRDAHSHLNFYRQLLQWRRTKPVLVYGEQTLLPVHPQVMAFVREHDGQRVLCAFNFSDQVASLHLSDALQPAHTLAVPGLSGGCLSAKTLAFEPYGGLLVQLL